MIDLNKLKELAAKASPGPWHIGHVNEEHGWADIVSLTGEIIADDVDMHNQSYLCAVDPQSLLKLIQVIEAYEGQLSLRTKRSFYQWAEGTGKYTQQDWDNEASIKFASYFLQEFLGQRKEILGE